MLPRLLLAHKVPWSRFAMMIDRTEMLWRDSPSLAARVYCEGPPCADCAAVADQHACIIDAELVGMPEETRNASSATCWPKCRFTKAKPPEVPAQCWNGTDTPSRAGHSAAAAAGGGGHGAGQAAPLAAAAARPAEPKAEGRHSAEYAAGYAAGFAVGFADGQGSAG